MYPKVKVNTPSHAVYRKQRGVGRKRGAILASTGISICVLPHKDGLCTRRRLKSRLTNSHQWMKNVSWDFKNSFVKAIHFLYVTSVGIAAACHFQNVLVKNEVKEIKVGVKQEMW